MLNKKSYIAANKFGLGVNPRDVLDINQNPFLWVKNQLDGDAGDTLYLEALDDSVKLNRKLLAIRASKDREKIKVLEKEFKKLFTHEIKQRTLHAINTKNPFLERLTYFWSNHFTVSVRKKGLFHLAGAFEREAIRPNILGKFSDLLLNVVMHPAMLTYLDNISSIGPNSKIGLKRSKGLNENLAREILELHTLGVNGGYRQTDVIALAKLITGWSVAVRGGNAGGFYFNKRAHEPGQIGLLGRYYSDEGVERGKKALLNIAHHPSTADFVAKKLVSHFISHKAPKSIIREVRNVFYRSRGDLKRTYQKLISVGAAWSDEYSKIKTNQDLIISLGRAAKKDNLENNKYYFNSFRFLGNAPFTANSPAGFSDVNSEILSAEIIMRRIEWAELAASRLKFDYSPVELSKLILGEFMSFNTFDAISDATSKKHAYAILLAAPEFQKRS